MQIDVRGGTRRSRRVPEVGLGQKPLENRGANIRPDCLQVPSLKSTMRMASQSGQEARHKFPRLILLLEVLGRPREAPAKMSMTGNACCPEHGTYSGQAKCSGLSVPCRSHLLAGLCRSMPEVGPRSFPRVPLLRIHPFENIFDSRPGHREGARAGPPPLERALASVCGADFSCKLMCGAGPGDPGGSGHADSCVERAPAI